MNDVGYALIVFALINLLDYITTHYALRRGLVEANPIARLIYNRFGTVGLFSYKQVGTGVIVLNAYAFTRDIEPTLWIYNFLLALVVAWNSLMLFLAVRRRAGG